MIANDKILKTFKCIDSAKRLIVAIHKHPDGDTVGAGLGLAHVLWERGRDVQLFCRSKVGKQFSYLDGMERIETDPVKFIARRPDVLVVLDSGDLNFCGIADLLEECEEKPYIINIDHHATNEFFGDSNLVEKDASSTVEVLYSCLRSAGWRLSQKAANCFLTGLMTDTGVFSNLATTPSSLAVAADLLAVGAKPRTVIKHNYRNKNLGTLRLWGEAFERLKRHEKLGIVATVITQKDLKKHNAREEDTEGLTNFLNSLSDAEAMLLLVEQKDGTIKGSLRSTKDKVDVSRIAKIFGGGGHKKAAGFTIPGRLVRLGDSWKIISNF